MFDVVGSMTHFHVAKGSGLAPQQLSDADLLARTRAGDGGAFDELYRRHIDDTRRVALLVTRAADEADDIVSEAFARVLDRLRKGGGPDGELTPYLRTVVRRLAIDRYRVSGRGGPAADPAMFDAIPHPDDPVEIATTRDMVRRAYETLPSRWQRVLWRTEVEGRSPAEVAVELGSTPNAIAALAYRAREGLRQAYLKMHVAGAVSASCKPYVGKLTALLRGSLSPADEAEVNAHVGACPDCRERRDEMLVLVSDMRSVLVPALLGFIATSGVAGAVGLAGVTAAGATAAGAAGAATAGPPAGSLAKLRHLRPRGASLVTGVTATAAASAVAVAMVSGMLGGAPDAPPPQDSVAAGAPDEEAVPLSGSPTDGATSDMVVEPTADPTDEPTVFPTDAVTGEPVQPPGSPDEPADDVATSPAREPAAQAEEDEPDTEPEPSDPDPESDETPEPEPEQTPEPEPEPEAFDVHPRSVTARSGESVVMEAKAGTLDVRWQRRNGSGWADAGSGNELTMTATPELDGASYRAVADRVVGERLTSEAATLNVQYGPNVTVQPYVASRQGSWTTLRAEAEGNPQITSARWQMRGLFGWVDITSTRNGGVTEATVFRLFEITRFRVVFTSDLGTTVSEELRYRPRS